VAVYDQRLADLGPLIAFNDGAGVCDLLGQGGLGFLGLGFGGDGGPDQASHSLFCGEIVALLKHHRIDYYHVGSANGYFKH